MSARPESDVHQSEASTGPVGAPVGGAATTADAAGVTIEGPGSPRRSWLLAQTRTAGILVPFLVLFIVLSVASSTFLSKENLLQILEQQASTLIVASAGTLVLVSGGLDLSTGAVYCIAGIITGKLLPYMPVGPAILIGILSGMAIGTINGVIATIFRINALIATLAMYFVVTGASSLITQGNIVVLQQYGAFGSFANSSFLGVATAIWVMVIVVIGLGLLLSRTTLGRYMYAAGGNAEAARIAGVRVNLVRIVAFALSGGAAALGGLIDAARVLSAGDQTSLETFTFTALAGIVVGGTSILGGEGAVWRSVVGVLLIALIGNGFILLNLNPLWEQVTLGVIMILAVGVDAWTRQRV